MPKRNTQTPPLTRDPIITLSRAQNSTSGEQIAQGSDTIPATPTQEQSTPVNRYVLLSLTLGPITVEQILKGNSDKAVEIRRKFNEERLTQNLPQTNNQSNPSSGDLNIETHHDVFSEPSTPGLDLDSLFQESATP